MFTSTLQYNTKSTVCLCPQIAKANHGGQRYTQFVVKPVIIKLQPGLTVKRGMFHHKPEKGGLNINHFTHQFQESTYKYIPQVASQKEKYKHSQWFQEGISQKYLF